MISDRGEKLFLDEIYIFRSRTGIENFQLCASLEKKYIDLHYLRIHSEKYFLKISSTENDQKTTITMSPLMSVIPIEVCVLQCVFRFPNSVTFFKFDIMPTDELIKVHVKGPDSIWRTFFVRDLVDSDQNL